MSTKSKFVAWVVIIIPLLILGFKILISSSQDINSSMTPDQIDNFAEGRFDLVKRESGESILTLKGEDKNKNGIRDNPERLMEALLYHDYDYDYNYNKIKKVEIYRMVLRAMQKIIVNDEKINNVWLEYKKDEISGKLTKKDIKKVEKVLLKQLNIFKLLECVNNEINENNETNHHRDIDDDNYTNEIIAAQLNTVSRRQVFSGPKLHFKSVNSHINSIIGDLKRLIPDKYSRLKNQKSKIEKNNCNIKELKNAI